MCSQSRASEYRVPDDDDALMAPWHGSGKQAVVKNHLQETGTALARARGGSEKFRGASSSQVKHVLLFQTGRS